MGNDTKNTDIEKRILFMNDDLIIVNKLAGEAMEGPGPGQGDLPKLLTEYTGPVRTGIRDFFPTAVHRLDVPVTGCALFARTQRTLSFLNSSFARTMYEGGRAEKYYWAIVELSDAFNALPEAGELLHWIKTESKKNKSIASEQKQPRQKESILRYRVKGRGENYGFLEIDLVTGRHHQIRAQLAAAGLHIKGDLKYGASRSEKSGGIRLHARSLYFPDPSVAGNFIQAAANPPVMDKLWRTFCGS